MLWILSSTHDSLIYATIIKIKSTERTRTMLFSRYFLYFYLYSLMGWVYETIVMTIWTRKWDNRGFLFEPVLPIYGFGATALSIILDYLTYHNIEYTWKQLFMLAFIGSIFLEYFTGWFLEKMFHAYWWDYSRVPLNIKGRICLFASLGFGVAGLVVSYYIYPFTSHLVDKLRPSSIELLSMVCMAILSADTALTVSSLINFEEKVVHMEEKINNHMDTLVRILRKKAHLSNPDELSEDDKTMLDSIVKLMNNTQRNTIGRIKGFKRKKSVKKLNYMLKVIKDKSYKLARKNHENIKKIENLRGKSNDDLECSLSGEQVEN